MWGVGGGRYPRSPEPGAGRAAYSPRPAAGDLGGDSPSRTARWPADGDDPDGSGNPSRGERPAASLADMFTHALIDVAAAPAVRGLHLVARPRVRRPALAGRDAHRRA
ncbi:hypothetical protein GCM10027259_14340 [Micromonospora palomenae]